MIPVVFGSIDFIDKLAVCEICYEINLLNLGSLLSLFTEMSNNYSECFQNEDILVQLDE